ncbi:hypothetical protein [Desulfocastanea catecholica]
MNEQKLIEKLRLIEALFSGAATKGEEVAAELARERILERLRFMEKEEPLIEYRFTMADMWTRKVFVALLRRYGINPYRYSGQRYTTVMARVSKKFVDETLWPEFNEISETLKAYLSEITDRVVTQVIHQDSSEAEVVKEPALIGSGNVDATASDASPIIAAQSDHTSDSSDKRTQTIPQGSRRKKKKQNRGKKKR